MQTVADFAFSVRSGHPGTETTSGDDRTDVFRHEMLWMTNSRTNSELAIFTFFTELTDSGTVTVITGAGDGDENGGFRGARKVRVRRGELEKCVFVDPGNRGIGGMWTHGCLERIVAEIWKCDRNKASYVLTGFCCKGETTETDGPLGSVVLCAMLRAVGFNTFLLTDRNSSRVVIAAAGECPVMVTDDPKAVRDPAFIVSVERPARSA